MQRDRNNGKASSFRWGYIHLALFVTGVLTFGFLDAFTAGLMMEKYGITAEFNPLIRAFILTHGITGFIVFKVVAATLILSAPLLLYNGEKKWTTAGFLSAFAVNGALAAMNNYIFLTSGQVWVDPVMIIVAALLMVAVMLPIGEMMDAPQKGMFKISDEEWERMKLEMGYPVGSHYAEK